MAEQIEEIEYKQVTLVEGEGVGDQTPCLKVDSSCLPSLESAPNDTKNETCESSPLDKSTSAAASTAEERSGRHRSSPGNQPPGAAWRWPASLCWLAFFGLLLVTYGVFLRYVADAPLVGYTQKDLVRPVPYDNSDSLVPVARKPIAVGDVFDSDNVELRARGKDEHKYAVRNLPAIWGMRASKSISVDETLNARKIDDEHYNGVTGWITTHPVKIGEMITSSNSRVVYLPAHHKQADKIENFHNSSVVAKSDLPPGTLLLNNMVKQR